YYNTQGMLYTEAMSYRQQFPLAPFFPLYPSPEAWNEHRRVDRLEYEAIMDHNEAVFHEQYGAFEAQRRAQE
ncbi:hypothetical protein A2U01_0106900, partial [Trifolium medium]|nr:hypothetical protein [Trifolium medium]